MHERKIYWLIIYYLGPAILHRFFCPEKMSKSNTKMLKFLLTNTTSILKPHKHFIISNFPFGKLQGMRKHKLLRKDILSSMASNRKVQRLLNEFVDLLSEYENADANQDQGNPMLPNSSSPAINQIETGSLVTDQVDTAVLDDQDNAQLEKDQTSFPPKLANETSSDAPMTDQVNQDSQAKEEGS